MKKQILALVFCLIGNSGMSQTHEAAHFRVTGLEPFWAISCDPVKGLYSLDFVGTLDRITRDYFPDRRGYDGVGVNFSHAAVINKTTVELKGQIYGVRCDRKTDQDEYQWQIMSLKNVNTIRPYISANKSLVHAYNKDLELLNDWDFFFTAPVDRFFKRSDARKIKNGEALGLNKFMVVFSLREDFSRPTEINLKGPMIEYTYLVDEPREGVAPMINPSRD